MSSHGDEHAAFDRPRRRSRPRTKDRPDYADAELGMVVTVDRGRFTALVDDREVSATKARQLGRTGVIVGDQVSVVGDTSGEEGTLARIVAVAERETVLRRTADDDDPYERPIVANADQLVIVTALADPPPRTGMIDRILVAGFDAGLDPLLCLTKADLASPDELLGQYEPLDVPVQVTSPGADLAPLRAALAGHRSVFVGHSGVGKSTLVNALIPGAAPGDRRRSTRSPAAAGTPPAPRSRCACPTRPARLGDRHPRGPLLRAQPRDPGADRGGVRRPGRRHGRLPARLPPRPSRARVRPGRRRGRRKTSCGPGGVVPPDARVGPVAWAPCPRPRP